MRELLEKKQPRTFMYAPSVSEIAASNSLRVLIFLARSLFSWPCNVRGRESHNVRKSSGRISARTEENS